MKRVNQEMKEKLQDGKIAIDNTKQNNPHGLSIILLECFPKDNSLTNGLGNFYSVGANKDIWMSYKKCDLPSYPIESFLEDVPSEDWQTNEAEILIEIKNAEQYECQGTTEQECLDTQQQNFDDYNILEHLEVGSKVFDWVLQEWGIVKETNGLNKPILADFNDCLNQYFEKGNFNELDLIPCLTLEEWHPLSGKPFPKLPIKRKLEVFVLLNKNDKRDYTHVIGNCCDKYVNESMLTDENIKYPLMDWEIIERTPYTGSYLK